MHSLVAWSLWPHPPQRPARAAPLLIHAQIFERPSKATPVATPTISSPPIQQPTPPEEPSPEATQQLRQNTAVQPVNVSAPPAIDPEGYLPIEAVDEPASPMGDWLVDTEVLPHGYTLRMVILLWISASGNIDKWELDGQSGNRAFAMKALMALDRTAVKPAIRNNIAVPSYRRLEMVITHD
jgi:hypothetical protein